MKKKNLIIIIIAGSVGVLLLMLLVAAGSVKGRKAGVTTTVRLETVAPGEFVEIINAPGEIRPKSEVDISAKVSARIVELPVKEGDKVKEGDILIRLDSKDLESQLRSAEASRDAQKAGIEVEKARILSQTASLKGTLATLKQQEQEFERQHTLLVSNDVSQASFDQCQSRLDELKAQYEAAAQTIKAAELNLIVMDHNLKAADARVEEVQEALSYTTISSPIDGVITQLNAEVGEVVMTGTMNNPGTVILQVADLGVMMLYAELDETNVGQVKIGQKAKIHVPAFWEDEFEGVVQNIALTYKMSQTGSKSYKTEILVEGDVSKLVSGLTADVDIETNRFKDVIKVPSQSVLARRVDILPLEITDDSPIVDKNKTEIPVVYLFKDGKAIAAPVKIGPSDLTHTLIRDGVKEGDSVIVGPYKILEGLQHNAAVVKEEKKEPAQDAKKDKKADADAKKDNKAETKV
ncbi:MAG: efflux RND transporter periplasmic adaptor subunit [Planctomycetaceae bacterium]|nr:efflux RND transporter periplasmic adaptor subunit [Planctomycetaceae bacterium]